MADTNGASTFNENPGLVARLGAKAQRFKSQMEGLQREMESLKSRLDTAEREREELRSRADSSVHLKEVERLRKEMRLTRHRNEFEKVAREAGANPKAIDDVFAASGWKAEADDVDVEAMRATIATLKAEKDYYFTGGSSADQSMKPVKPAPGSGKGEPIIGGGPVISEELAANDPGYIMRNWNKISEFYRNKTDVVE